MTLDEAIKHAEEIAEEHTRYNRYGGFESCTECAKEHRQLANWLKELKQLKEQTRWIPCSEKKPNKGGEYLLWGKIDESEEEDYCFIGDYHEFDEVFGIEMGNYDPRTLGFLDTEIEEYSSVVAWMPLPEPYKEESEDKE